MGRGEAGISFKARVEQRSRTPDDHLDQVNAARRAATLRSWQVRAQRSADAQSSREAKQTAELAKAEAAVVVESDAAVSRRRRIEANRATATAAKRPRQRKKVRLKQVTNAESVAKIKLEIDRMEDIARNCRANFIRHQYKVYRRRRARIGAESAKLVQRCWRGGRERCMLKRSLAARTLQVAWREYATRLAAVRSDLMLVSVVRLQRAYFREKRRRCELLYQLAAEAKDAACARHARLQTQAAEARQREDAAKALALAEKTARLQERMRTSRIRRQKIAKRRRVLRTAVRLIRTYREEEERQIVRALEIECMQRILRKFLRKKMLRRLAAQSFASERVSRVNKKFAACTRTIERALRAGETRAGTTGSAEHQDVDTPDDWDWGEGEDIIRSLHLRKVLGTMASPVNSIMEKGNTLSQRRALADRLERLPSPRQKAVMEMLTMTCPECCVDRTEPNGPQEVVVDLARIDNQTLLKVRAAIGAENAASTWQRPTTDRATTTAAALNSQRHAKLVRLTRTRTREKMARRGVSDGATELRRTLKHEINSLGGEDVHARGMKFLAASHRGRRPGTIQNRQGVSRDNGDIETVRDVHSILLKVDDAGRHSNTALRQLELEQRTETMRLRSPYNRRLSPLAKRHEDRMAATEPTVHDDSEWVARQLQHQAPILLGLASSSSPPPTREVDRRAVELGMPPTGSLLSYGERIQSPPAYRKRRRQERVDASLLGRIQLSHAMQEEMEQAVLDEQDVVTV